MKPTATAHSLDIDFSRIESVCRRTHVRELSVFGSASRREMNPDSDIDFLVEFDPSARVGFLDIARTTRELSDVLGRNVDLVPKACLKPLIRQQVLDESEIIFAA